LFTFVEVLIRGLALLDLSFFLPPGSCSRYIAWCAVGVLFALALAANYLYLDLFDVFTNDVPAPSDRKVPIKIERKH
jgi:hypothetical protein